MMVPRIGKYMGRSRRLLGLIGSHGMALYLALTVLAAFHSLHHHEAQAPFSAGESHASTGGTPSHSDDASAHSSCLLCAWHSQAQDTDLGRSAATSPLRLDDVPDSHGSPAHPRPALDVSCPP